MPNDDDTPRAGARIHRLEAARRSGPNLQPVTAEGWHRLFGGDAGLRLEPLSRPELLAFLAAARRAELAGRELEDLLVPDRFDMALLVATAMEARFLDADGRVTGLGREWAEMQLAPLMPLVLSQPGGDHA